ncbi:trafficking protein particle complex subunit 6B-like [Hylaeus volcanicus]|uniref:trafficking protein particle complex subunit 6B-like n=1 Tax=Hylaeus volcanicus TaxID=313075 RepID=UPI0023B8598A|nr:trafficking protein particle complex subunit 6B-like [Hylaeus volcanicus]
MQTPIESPKTTNDSFLAVKKNEDSRRKLSETFYYFLLHEIIKYTYQALSQSINIDKKLVANQCRLFFEKFGFTIGVKIHERLSIQKQRICKPEDCLKFVCKNLWDFLFFKQADRLQTNRKAEFMIMDKNLPPLRYGIQPPTAQYQLFCYSSKASLPFFCGIIRGVLTNLNLPNCVTADARNPPTCYFHIHLT